MAPDPRLSAPGTDEAAAAAVARREPGWQVGAALRPVRDSVLALQGERWTFDWTRTDGRGRRWGLSDDGLHVASVTIALEVAGGPGAGAGGLDGWEAMTMAARRLETREVLRQRERLMREQAARARKPEGR